MSGAAAELGSDSVEGLPTASSVTGDPSRQAAASEGGDSSLVDVGTATAAATRTGQEKENEDEGEGIEEEAGEGAGGGERSGSETDPDRDSQVHGQSAADHQSTTGEQLPVEYAPVLGELEVLLSKRRKDEFAIRQLCRRLGTLPSTIRKKVYPVLLGVSHSDVSISTALSAAGRSMMLLLLPA